ncbi:unnamed protein product [Hyaloperonospora brassicae]|uniref:UBC core domain-containing protein n=1 Tax=Hyaloperonospora brassicae TaxID=162125 RepID=A0AAV0UP79_HYABA|nr:unnamed protein product [Hyaloperonospora brassicae]
MVTETSSSSSSSSSPTRQRHIWYTRVQHELEQCRVDGTLPRGATLRRVQLSEPRGVCEGEFHCFVPFVDGSDALFLVPLTTLVVRMPFLDPRVDLGQVQYPFAAPEIDVRHGALYLPPDLREQKGPKVAGEDPTYRLKLPLLEHWRPSTTVTMLVEQLFQLVQQHDPTPSTPVVDKKVAPPHGYTTKHAKKKQLLRMRKQDVRGIVYPCQEVDFTTSVLKQTPLLVQSGNIALLVPSSEAKGSEFVYVQELISLQDVVRITPQRGKSVTLFFKQRTLPCRTFLSQRTDEIVNDLRIMIDETGSHKRRHNQSGTAGRADTTTQLLSFLSAEQSEKAKEISAKFMGKLGKVATSVSRFLRGDEDEAMEQQQTDPLAKAFAELDVRKEAFYRVPSKARMTEIARRYQYIAEEYACHNNKDGHVERAISELQAFIEHPKTQRILMETCAYEQSTAGIRVGPA